MRTTDILVYCFACLKMLVKNSKYCQIYEDSSLTLYSLRKLPKDDAKRRDAIQPLRERGILAVERIEELSGLAKAVYGHLWDCVASLTTEINQPAVPSSSMSNHHES